MVSTGDVQNTVKVNNKDNRTIGRICLNFTTMIPERQMWHYPSNFVANF